MDMEKPAEKTGAENEKCGRINVGALGAMLLATVFFLLQIFLGGGMNYGLYAIVFAVPCAEAVAKALRLRSGKEIALAAAYCVIVLAFSAAYIWELVSAAAQ